MINLAARAGVRASIEDPHVYLATNTTGTLNLLERMVKHGISKFVIASTSSLYAGQPMPFTEDAKVTRPISPYAATKLAAEALSYVWHHLHGLDVSLFRYFTVYGPAGRPDMAPFRFSEWIRRSRHALPVSTDHRSPLTRHFSHTSRRWRQVGAIRKSRPTLQVGTRLRTRPTLPSSAGGSLHFSFLVFSVSAFTLRNVPHLPLRYLLKI
ncbi:MAG: NAD-dependent epimerase/dehydratase family protein [Luteolibacter sp.]